MKNINIPALLLATLITLLFVAVGVAIAYKNIWMILLFLMLGFSIMGLAMSRKKQRK